ncbi:type VI secretion system contractile sheath small subunit [Pyxidicoccus fallax]|uniref:Type VI secretion system contractile sheath small subunit n=1 Tax=Pyxidicoccus fallax TaxID=394095 RepID=A0A848LLK2_9BACT|nr:type VI secretion system contractile sheath small subunit [Pyxidicoccus fallax]NMO18638.1 type VI secretion system contractile sheath small subunit [Pyxidicoccus fallax]NPC79043.1 type VI secretion system contractile sheath small subunit [Pyxidicoccus fallax]
MSIQDALPTSRITLTYRTTINGKEEEVDLPFRMLALADLSLGSSKDRRVDLDERRLRSVKPGGLDDLMKDMGMSIEFQVPDRTSASGDGTLDVKLPLERMKSFHPDEFVQHVPKLKALLLMRKLLLEMQADIDNRKELWRTLSELYARPEDIQQLLESDALKGFENLRLPAGDAKSA